MSSGQGSICFLRIYAYIERKTENHQINTAHEKNTAQKCYRIAEKDLEVEEVAMEEL